ncbi:MAG: glycosyltransferase family 4 protein [Arcobacteraceae bacterium]|nr:glycosyltransferase family 4 protein [Arcobacteraceae bacterium]
MQDKNTLFFVESYITGGSDKIARLIIENISSNIYLMVNKNAPKNILLTGLKKDNIKIIYYSLISPAMLGAFASRFKQNRILYIGIRALNLILRYPLIIFSIIYFYFLIKPLKIDVYFSNNGGYPGGEYNRSSSLAASFILKNHTYHIYHSIPQTYNKFTGFIEGFYDKILDKRLTFITDSNYCAKELLAKRNIKSLPKVIYNGTQPLNKKKYTDFPILKLLIVGVLDSNKNQLFALKILSSLIKKNYNIKLYIVGNEAEIGYENTLKSYVIKNNLIEYVSFEGFQTNLSNYYNECDILLLTSIIESFPTVILEAMSVGMPIISAQAGGVLEQIQIGKNGFVVAQDDLDDFVQKIIFFIENKSRISEFGSQSYKIFNEKFTINNMVKNYQKIIDKE